jgi:hypothetical protein
MLEDFFSSLSFVEADDLWAHAQRVVQDLPRREFRHEVKANVHTWLAWQSNPGQPMGVSIKVNPKGATSDAAEAFLRFVREMLA